MAKKKITDQDINDAYLRRALNVLRAAEGEAENVAKLLSKATSEINDDIVKTFSMGTPSKFHVDTLKKKAKKSLESFYKTEFPSELLDAQADMIEREIVWHSELFKSVYEGKELVAPSSVTITATNSPSLEQIRKVAKIVAKTPYQGETFSHWIQKAYPSHYKKINSVLTEGMGEGKVVAELIRDINAVHNASTRDVKTIARSYFMQTAKIAKEETMKVKEIDDLIEAYIWVSTLDARTTPLICGIRDGKKYSKDHEPIGHDLSYESGPGSIHWNCRSQERPLIKGVKDSPIKRPAVGPGENYERGDNKNSRGKVVKLSRKKIDEGVFSVQEKTSKTSYEGWLREQSKKNIDWASDVLGSKERARQFRDGATLAELAGENPVANPIRAKKL